MYLNTIKWILLNQISVLKPICGKSWHRKWSLPHFIAFKAAQSDMQVVYNIKKNVIFFVLTWDKVKFLSHNITLYL